MICEKVNVSEIDRPQWRESSSKVVLPSRQEASGCTRGLHRVSKSCAGVRSKLMEKDTCVSGQPDMSGIVQYG